MTVRHRSVSLTCVCEFTRGLRWSNYGKIIDVFILIFKVKLLKFRLNLKTSFFSCIYLQVGKGQYAVKQQINCSWPITFFKCKTSHFCRFCIFWTQKASFLSGVCQSTKGFRCSKYSKIVDVLNLHFQRSNYERFLVVCCKCKTFALKPKMLWHACARWQTNWYGKTPYQITNILDRLDLGMLLFSLIQFGRWNAVSTNILDILYL